MWVDLDVMRFSSLSRNYGILLIAPAVGGFLFTSIAHWTQRDGSAAPGLVEFTGGLWVAVALSLVAVALAATLTQRYRTLGLFPVAQAEKV